MKKSHYYFTAERQFFLHKRNIWCRKDASERHSRSEHRRKRNKTVSTNMDGAYKIKVKQGATIVLVTLVFQCGKATTASNKCSFV
jgi:hypothetical protein